VVVLLELRPVHRDDDLLAGADDELHPSPLQREEVDPRVAQQPVDLLDPALRRDPRQARVRLTDRMDRQHGA
jgi:hypothetical protein